MKKYLLYGSMALIGLPLLILGLIVLDLNTNCYTCGPNARAYAKAERYTKQQLELLMEKNPSLTDREAQAFVDSTLKQATDDFYSGRSPTGVNQ
jgi:hypothetical protein